MARAFSVEDGNLSSSIISARGTKSYSDVDLLFSINNVGDVYKKKDVAAVKQSVKNIIMTNMHERPFRPTFGSNLSKYLFENFSSSTEYRCKLEIEYAIKNYEPRAKLESVKVKKLEEQNALYVTVEFYVVNIQELVTLNVTLARLR